MTDSIPDTAATGDPWSVCEKCGVRWRIDHKCSTPATAAHPATCVGPYEDEAHIQSGECYCDCPVCTSPDDRCICPDCNPVTCPDHVGRAHVEGA